MDSKNQNTHVTEFLDYYCNLDVPPSYALQVLGTWGAGKTYFVKKYMASNNKKYKFLYVSLYGMSDCQEINDDLFCQLHPILSSKTISFATKVLKGSLKTTLKIDLDGDGKSDGSATFSLPDNIKIPESMKTDSRTILVFDDFERASMSPHKLLGFINSFVEHQQMKTIIVCNEDEVGSVNKEERQLYIRTREKVIGRSFKIFPDTDAALSHFIEESLDESAKIALCKNFDLVKDIYHMSSYQNLRHLRLAMLDFSRIYVALDTEFKEHKEVVSHLIAVYTMLFIEFKGGALLAGELDEFRIAHYKLLYNSGEKNNIVKLANIRKKYTTLNYDQNILSSEIWERAILEGVIDKEKINERLKLSEYMTQKYGDEWRTVWEWRTQDEDDLISALNKTKSNFDNRKYHSFGEVCHVFGLLLWLSKEKLIDRSRESILADGKLYVDSYQDKDTLFKGFKENSISGTIDSWGGLGFYEKESSEFSEFYVYAMDSYRNYVNSSYPLKADELLQTMEEDSDLFYKKLVYTNHLISEFHNVPILCYIDKKKFLAAFMELRGADKSKISLALQSRYEDSNFIEDLLFEEEWLESLLFNINAQLNSIKGTFKYLQVKALQHVVELGLRTLRQRKQV